ncbi:class I SAM-dependent methyltransferase [uncultured Marivirga sp.]|uniref:class I SAM-dependent methyltransferase n=1 Tax=uncultured Marivirga sp. TaxID=1123707 RepID=UPI0030EE3574|tara:strand:+ start:30075 stop:30680 length:606 start_codon:yes stop_codon:yes gene_type:complete
MADFDRIAASYNHLKKIVFYGQVELASRHFVENIPPSSEVLIIGGGTGQLLAHFKSTHQINYLELSRSMINKAKKVTTDASIEFIHTDVLEWESDKRFDVIVTPFILDCFNEDSLNLLIPKLKSNLSQGGIWIHTDFCPKNAFQKLLVKAMYLFFRITAKLKVKELADFDSLFIKHGFICKRKVLFYHSMVESKIYQQIDG